MSGLEHFGEGLPAFGHHWSLLLFRAKPACCMGARGSSASLGLGILAEEESHSAWVGPPCSPSRLWLCHFHVSFWELDTSPRWYIRGNSEAILKSLLGGEVLSCLRRVEEGSAFMTWKQPWSQKPIQNYWSKSPTERKPRRLWDLLLNHHH